MPFDHVAKLGDDRRHELPAGLPVAAARIKHGLELINQEGDVATFSEHRRDDARQRHDPLEMVEILRVDEDLERAALLVLRALVEHNVVDRDVHRVIGHGRLDLVRRADEDVRSLDLLVHPHDFRSTAVLVLELVRIGNEDRFDVREFLIRLLDVVFDDLLRNLDGHNLDFLNVYEQRPNRKSQLT